MKKILLMLLAAIGFFLLPSSKVLAQAQVSDTHLEFDLSELGAGECGYYSCTGSALTFVGILYSDNHSVTNKNTAITSSHVTGNLTATDANGNTYSVKHNSSFTQVVPVVNGGLSYTFILSVRFISQGSAPNFTLRINRKFTIDVNGVITVDRNEVTTNCD